MMRILQIEDNPADALVMRAMLATAAGVEFRLDTVDRLEAGLRYLRTRGADLIMVDLHLPDSEGIETVRRVCDGAPHVPIIVLTGLDDEDLALAAVRKGAQDYLVKGHVDERNLRRSIHYAVERHQTIAALRHHARMQALGQLTAGAAHEFNNMLAVILGNVELLQRDERFGGQPREMLNSIAAAVKRGRMLTGGLQAFCGMQPLAPKSVSFADAFQDLTIVVGSTLGKHLSLDVDLPANTWPARADTAQLRLALTHLIMNARDAMSTSGVIRLSVANLEIDETCARAKRLSPGRYVAVTVQDHGCGMAQDTLERACEPFFTTKEVGRGVGLGLSMVDGFARQSGGALELASDVGVGTTATLILPAHADPGRPADTTQGCCDLSEQ